MVVRNLSRLRKFVSPFSLNARHLCTGGAPFHSLPRLIVDLSGQNGTQTPPFTFKHHSSDGQEQYFGICPAPGINSGKMFKKMPGDEEKGSRRPMMCRGLHYQKSVNENAVKKFWTSKKGLGNIVLLLANITDFEGSFPDMNREEVAEMIAGVLGEKVEFVTTLIVTKRDLLPVGNEWPEWWTRHWASWFDNHPMIQSNITGLNNAGFACVYPVTAVEEVGVQRLKLLVNKVIGVIGDGGNVWVVGANNAGKRTLIKAMGISLGAKTNDIIWVPVSGAPLGTVRVEGLLPGNFNLFCTPAPCHSCQLWTRLIVEEQKLVHITKMLKPRTYRIKEGQFIHVGGLARLDVEKLEMNKPGVEIIYVTVWASHLLPLHMGETKDADSIFKEHAGHQLHPPFGKQRVDELGEWKTSGKFHVSGTYSELSSYDVVVVGLGWFAVALEGKADLSVWTYKDVPTLSRVALLPERARQLEASGITVPKNVP